jgi:hypothetical protein
MACAWRRSGIAADIILMNKIVPEGIDNEKKPMP